MTTGVWGVAAVLDLRRSLSPSPLSSPSHDWRGTNVESKAKNAVAYMMMISGGEMRVVDHSDCEYNTKKHNGYSLCVIAAMDGSVAETGVCTRACDEYVANGAHAACQAALDATS